MTAMMMMLMKGNNMCSIDVLTFNPNSNSQSNLRHRLASEYSFERINYIESIIDGHKLSFICFRHCFCLISCCAANDDETKVPQLNETAQQKVATSVFYSIKSA